MVKDAVCLMEFDLLDAGAIAVNDGHAYYFCSDECQKIFISSPGLYLDKTLAERMIVGVLGSAGNEHDPQLAELARNLGSAIAHQGLILITGACRGLPYECAQGARDGYGLSVGIFPALSLDENTHPYKPPADAYDVIIYNGSGLMGREVTNIRSSDIVIIIGGRSGTLGGFTIAYDEGKLIGVLKGSDGITDEISGLVESFGKDTGAEIIYKADPEELIGALLKAYTERRFHHPSCFVGADC